MRLFFGVNGKIKSQNDDELIKFCLLPYSKLAAREISSEGPPNICCCSVIKIKQLYKNKKYISISCVHNQV
jgi:hypothetical protein